MVEKKVSGFLVISYTVDGNQINQIGKSLNGLVEKLPKNYEQYIVFNTKTIDFNVAKELSNKIYDIGCEAILDRESQIVVKKGKLNDSDLDNLVGSIIKVG